MTTKVGVDAYCMEQFVALKECMTTNEKKWSVCSEIRESLEKCAVKNKLGELADKQEEMKKERYGKEIKPIVGKGKGAS